jgi:hypothetical protein
MTTLISNSTVSTESTTPRKKVPFSFESETSKQAYRSIGKMVRKHLGEKEVLRRWNNTQFGKFAKLSTIDRWLNPGPLTKNSNFEPFVISLHSELLIKSSESSEQITKKDMDKLRSKLRNDKFVYIRNKATAASLLAYYEHDKNISNRQRELLSNLLNDE